MFHKHEWGWPWRDRETGRDMQTCTRCGAKRESSIQFPRQEQPSSSIPEGHAA
jgi:hypothetical protein